MGHSSLFSHCRSSALQRILVTCASIYFVSCDFNTYRPAYSLAPQGEYRLSYFYELQAKALNTSTPIPYATHADVKFILKESLDSSRGQIDLGLMVDSLDFHSSERAPAEDAYMVARLQKYIAHLLVMRSGQVVSLEEEPRVPLVEFSPLNFGRLFIYGLVDFPDNDIKVGSRWESEQPLLDKFHPRSRLIRHFKLLSVRKTPQGPIAEIEVTLEAFLEDGSGQGSSGSGSSLSGQGTMAFNFKTGRLISSDLKLEGLFESQDPERTSDSTPNGPISLQLTASLRLRFSG